MIPYSPSNKYAVSAHEQRALDLVEREAKQTTYSRLMESICEDQLPKLVKRTAERIKAGAQLDALDVWVIQCAKEFLEAHDEQIINHHDPVSDYNGGRL